MKELNLKSGQPQVMTLSADFRLGGANYLDDTTWKVSLAGGDPEALAVGSTFGLRSGGARFFPRFVRKDGTYENPAKFHAKPVVQQVFPNYLRVGFSPFAGLDARMEYQAAASNLICGRIWMQNKSLLKEQFRLEWCGVLNPLGVGQGLAAIQMDHHWVLQGSSADLHLVSCLGVPTKAGSGPFASLGSEVELFPNGQLNLVWAAAIGREDAEAFQLAQAALQRRFEAEAAHIQLVNESEEMEISTGNPDWDAALALSQRTARRLFFPAGGGLPAPSFVGSRQPDQGFSRHHDGSDHPPQWSGQTALDTYYISNLLLPGGLKWVQGLLRNFLAAQDEAGNIDWRPGLAGQRSRRLAQPLLASLALRAAEMTGETAWLQEFYPGLARFLWSWFGKDHDRDQDGFPEWDHPLQTGLEDSPMFDRWRNESQGMDLNVLESPALGAMLVEECRSLMTIGRLLGAEADIHWLEEAAEGLRSKIQEMWQSERGIYRYQDHATHAMSAGQEIFHFHESTMQRKETVFQNPQRLMVHLQSADLATRAATVTIHGKLWDEAVVEEIPPSRFSWVNGRGRCTGKKIFTSIQAIDVCGLLPGDEGWVCTPDYTLEDLSLFLPLWAGMPTEEQARGMLEGAIQAHWLEKYGLPTRPSAETMGANGVTMPWNLLIGEGFLKYGFRKEAADLMRRLLDGVVENLRNQQDFRAQVDALSGQGMGEAGHLHGLAPLGLFLRIAGIQQITPKGLIVQTGSPFSHAITVKYKGIGVTLTAKETQITFPSGQNLRLDEPGLHKVSWQ